MKSLLLMEINHSIHVPDELHHQNKQLQNVEHQFQASADDAN
jgi:hypothetical protein